MRHGSGSRWAITAMSASPPATSRPAGRPQQRANASPGLAVTIWTRSKSETPHPSRSDTILATLSSPSRFLVPDGPQSVPRHTFTPCARASGIEAVSPYSHRFENGDHTNVPGPASPSLRACSAHCANSAAPIALRWIANNRSRRQFVALRSSNSRRSSFCRAVTLSRLPVSRPPVKIGSEMLGTGYAARACRKQPTMILQHGL